MALALYGVGLETGLLWWWLPQSPHFKDEQSETQGLKQGVHSPAAAPSLRVGTGSLPPVLLSLHALPFVTLDTAFYKVGLPQAGGMPCSR